MRMCVFVIVLANTVLEIALPVIGFSLPLGAVPDNILHITN